MSVQHTHNDNDGAKDPQTGTTLSGHHAGVKYEEGKEGSHNRIDGKDQRSFANNIQDAKRVEQKEKDADLAKAQEMPTDAARAHGNEPSRGAKIDERIKLEEEAELARKGH